MEHRDLFNLDWVLKDLVKTRKALVVLGCSFGQGKVAYDVDLVKEHRPRRREHWGDCDYLDHEFTPEQLTDLSERYNIPVRDGKLDTKLMTVNNSFGSVICRDHLEGWTPVILATEGRGNFSNVDRLNWLPIDWKNLDAVKVIWQITDHVRTDIFTGTINDNHWVEYSGMYYETIWPFDVGEVDEFSRGYNRKLRTHCPEDDVLEKWFATNFLRLFSNVNNWCKAHYADLIMFDGFCDSYDKNRMIKLFANEMCDSMVLKRFVDGLPWHKKLKLDGHNTFFDMCMANETTYEYMLENKHNMWEFVEIPEEKITCDWIMPCGHPSAAGHKMLADYLAKDFL